MLRVCQGQICELKVKVENLTDPLTSLASSNLGHPLSVAITMLPETDPGTKVLLGREFGDQGLQAVGQPWAPSTKTSANQGVSHVCT